MLDAELYFAAIGGAMLAVATSFHLLVKGRVTGMSGIYFGVITADNKSSPWKLCFILISIYYRYFDSCGDCPCFLFGTDSLRHVPQKQDPWVPYSELRLGCFLIDSTMHCCGHKYSDLSLYSKSSGEDDFQ